MWTFPFILTGLSTVKFNYITGSHLMAVIGLRGQQLVVTSSPTKYLQLLDCCKDCWLSRRSVKVFLIPVSRLSYWVISFLITGKSSAQLGLSWVCWSFLPDEPNVLHFWLWFHKENHEIELRNGRWVCLPFLCLSGDPVQRINLVENEWSWVVIDRGPLRTTECLGHSFLNFFIYSCHKVCFQLYCVLDAGVG